MCRTKRKPPVKRLFTSDFRELHKRYPGLLGEDGYGWYTRNIHNDAEFIKDNESIVGKDTLKLADKIDKFDSAWWKKVIQC